jgi:hypothetical protein
MNSRNFNWTLIEAAGYTTIATHSGFWAGGCPNAHEPHTYCVTCRGPEPFLIPADHFAINMLRRAA